MKAQGAVFEGTGEINPVFTSDLHLAHTLDLGNLAAHPPADRRQSIRRSLGGQALPPPGGATHDDSDEEGEGEGDESGEMSMDMTLTEEEREREARRKSLAARRVSFAPNAHIR